MKKLITLIIVASVFLLGCITTDSGTDMSNESSLISVDGSYSDWNEIEATTIVIVMLTNYTSILRM